MTPKMEISASKKKFCPSVSWSPLVYLSRPSAAPSQGRWSGLVQLLCTAQLSYLGADTSWCRTQSQFFLVSEGDYLEQNSRLHLYGQRNWSTWMCYPNITELTQLIDSAGPRNVEELNHLSSIICLCWLFASLLKLKWEHLANISANFSLKSPSSLSFALLFESKIFPIGSGVWNLTLYLVILFWKVEVGQSLRVRSLLEEMNQQG